MLGKLDYRWALSGFFLIPVLITCLTLRWKIFLEQADISLPFRKVFMLTWAGQFFNTILPGSTGGDVYKIYQICRLNPQSRHISASTVLADRFSALLALFLIIAAGLLYDSSLLKILPTKGNFGVLPWAIGLAFIMVAGVLVLIFLWIFRSFLRKRILDLFGVLREAVTLNKGFREALIFSIAIHALSFLCFFLFARSLGVPISYVQVLIILPVLLLVVLLPITVNGHGLREVVMIGLFTQMNIQIAGTGIAEMVVALSILMISSEIFWNLPAGIWLLVARDWVDNRPSPQEDDIV